MSDRVLVSIDTGVADVRLNRADKLNALDGGMFEALSETGRELASHRDLRAVVLSGEGRAFCAGLDFASFQSMAGRSDSNGGSGAGLLEREPGSLANRAQRAGWLWQELPVPVIAAVHGYAFGGGLQIALGADIRLAHPESEFSVMEIRWGLVPDMSGTQTLRRLVRLDVAKELTFTGRRVRAPEALELGLVTRLEDDPRAAAFEMARGIAGRSPHAIQASKRLLNESGLLDVAAGLKLEEELQVSLIGGPNQLEAVRANLERRPPEFSDPE